MVSNLPNLRDALGDDVAPLGAEGLFDDAPLTPLFRRMDDLVDRMYKFVAGGLKGSEPVKKRHNFGLESFVVHVVLGKPSDDAELGLKRVEGVINYAGRPRRAFCELGE